MTEGAELCPVRLTFIPLNDEQNNLLKNDFARPPQAVEADSNNKSETNLRNNYSPWRFMRLRRSCLPRNTQVTNFDSKQYSNPTKWNFETLFCETDKPAPKIQVRNSEGGRRRLEVWPLLKLLKAKALALYEIATSSFVVLAMSSSKTAIRSS